MAETVDGNLAARIAVTLAVTRPPWVGQRDTGYWTAAGRSRVAAAGAAERTISGTSARRAHTTSRMDDLAWKEATAALTRAAHDVEILARCLAVGPQLSEWRSSASRPAGTDASDALDQARGLLEELARGRADELLALVKAIALDLPAPLE